jgi:FlaA1/EpsC-like NDP-sugar epimerase
MAEAEMELSERLASQTTSASRLPMRISERRLILMGLDLVAVVGALLVALALRPAYRLEPQLILQHPLWFLLLGVLWFLLADAFDAYDLEVSGRFSTAALAVLKAGGLTSVIYQFIPYVTPPLPASRGLLFAFPALTLALVTAGRGLYVLALDQPMFQRRALIVGAGWAGRTIAQALEENGNGTYETVGFVDDDPEKLGTAVTRGQGDKETGRQGDRGTRGQGEGCRKK